MAFHCVCRLSAMLLMVVLSACSAPLAGAPSLSEPSPVIGSTGAARAPSLPTPGSSPALAASPVTSLAAPTIPSAATPEALPTAAPADPEALIAAVDMPPRDLLGLAAAFQGLPAVTPTVRDTPRDLQVGDAETFWLIDRTTEQQYQSEFELRYAGPILLVYVERGVGFSQEVLEQGARYFEEHVYPRDRALFGSEWSPGVDGDPRLTVLMANLPGVCGYFSSRDSVPALVNRYSNEREMFYINSSCAPDGDLSRNGTLAHEFQHMIHWNQQRTSPIWFNEGLSTLAEDLNGFVSHSLATAYLREPDLQLTGWTYQPPRNTAHYGASQLFMRYVHEHYAGDEGIASLIAEDAGYDTQAFARLAARKRPDVQSFAQIVGDWAVANLLNDPAVADGRYAYAQLPEPVVPREVGFGSNEGSVAQFGADYLRLPEGPLSLHFDGSDHAMLLAARPTGQRAWWSNRGDDSMSTLTRELDLSGVSAARLEFDTWFEIETGFDYGFVAVSTDGGTNWQTLAGSHTTQDDPQGHNYGHGFTGVSGAPGAKISDGTRGTWMNERMDLTPYAGAKILLRFWYVTDDAENGAGMLIDNLRVPEIGWSDDAESGEDGWQAQGFVRLGTELAQRWELRLVRQGANGTTVERISPGPDGRADISVEAGDLATLVVIGATRFSGEVAPYTYEITSR